MKTNLTIILLCIVAGCTPPPPVIEIGENELPLYAAYGGGVWWFGSSDLEPKDLYGGVCAYGLKLEVEETDGVIIPFFTKVTFNSYRFATRQTPSHPEMDWKAFPEFFAITSSTGNDYGNEEGLHGWSCSYGNPDCYLIPTPTEETIPKIYPWHLLDVYLVAQAKISGKIKRAVGHANFLLRGQFPPNENPEWYANSRWGWLGGGATAGVPDANLPEPVFVTGYKSALMAQNRKKPQEYPAISAGGLYYLNVREGEYRPATKLILHSFDDINDTNGIMNYVGGNWPNAYIYDVNMPNLPDSGTMCLKSFDANGVLLAAMPFVFNRQNDTERFVSMYAYCVFDNPGVYYDYSGNPYVCILAVAGGHLEVSPTMEWFWADSLRGLLVFTDCWLENTSEKPECIVCDLNGDSYVNFADYAALVKR